MTSGNRWQALHHAAKSLTLTTWGKTLVVAPHPDDESLGCGGTIALLRQLNVSVETVFTSDGSMSHPNSKQYPADRLTALRKAEALAALQVLGVAENAVHFMGLKDSMVPDEGAIGFEGAVENFTRLLQTVQPEAVLVPWRLDPHKDHRATAQFVEAALQQYGKAVRKLEYLIWFWERGTADEFPQAEKMRTWQVDITLTKNLKMKAIAQHQSQTTRLINDDPEGFILSPEVLAHFDRDYELFVETIIASEG